MNIDINPFHKNNHYMTALAMLLSFTVLLLIALLGIYNFRNIGSSVIDSEKKLHNFKLIKTPPVKPGFNNPIYLS